MEYCQTLLLQSSNQAQFSICLFSPSASEPAGRDGGRAGQSDCIHTVEEGKQIFSLLYKEQKGQTQDLIIWLSSVITIMTIDCFSLFWWIFFRAVIYSAYNGILLGPRSRSGPVPSEKQHFRFLPFPPKSQTKSEQAGEPGSAATWGTQRGNHGDQLTFLHAICSVSHTRQNLIKKHQQVEIFSHLCCVLKSNMSLDLMLDISFVVVPRSGVRPRRSGENLFGPEESTSQETTGSADQQQS